MSKQEVQSCALWQLPGSGCTARRLNVHMKAPEQCMRLSAIVYRFVYVVCGKPYKFQEVQTT